MKCLIGGIVLFAAAWAQAEDTKPDAMPVSRMRVVLERRETGAWKAIDPGLVLSDRDHIRFRFKSNFPGYLYVLSHSTSGQYLQLFPSSETGTANRIEPEREYMVPSATDGSFRVTGPSGYDVVYWVVSPVELNAKNGPSMLPPPAPSRSMGPVSKLLPRCNEGLLKARGECVDSSAGTKELAPTRPVPPNLQALRDQSARELVFIREKDGTVVSSPQPIQGPVIYEFRIAHK